VSNLHPQPPPAATAHRLRTATWMNGRTALGAGLILLAVLAGALFLDRSQRLVHVYAAARDLPSGTQLRNGDLTVVRVRLPATALRHYLRPSPGLQIPGRVLSSPRWCSSSCPWQSCSPSTQDCSRCPSSPADRREHRDAAARPAHLRRPAQLGGEWGDVPVGDDHDYDGRTYHIV
jgi:hypothetical protein